MSNEIQTFDVTAHIRARVREIVISSIPDENIDAMIKQEYNDFFSAKRKYGELVPSEFQKMVQQEIRALVKEHICNLLKQWFSLHFESQFDQVSNEVVLVGDMVREFVPIVQAEMIGKMIGRALEIVRQEIGRW